MSTREPKPPAEAQMFPYAPSVTDDGRTPPLPSPGVSAGVTRIPTAPTLPEPDAATLTLAFARIANEVFGGPVSIDAPVQSAPVVGLQPASIANVGDVSAPAAAPTTPTLEAAPASLPSNGVLDLAVPATTPTTATVPATVAAPAQPREVSAATIDQDQERRVPVARAPSANPFFSEPQFDTALASSTFAGGVPELRFPFVDAGRDVSAPYFAPTGTAPASHVPAPSALGWEHSPVIGLDLPSNANGFDANVVRREFPILEERVHGKRLVWLDNAATTQKPRTVIDRISYFYEHENSNIHRAAHALAARATDAYEAARESVKRFLNASSSRDIVFVRGATEGINLVAQSWGRRHVRAGDEIVITWLEHHANIVPWQMLCAEKGAKLRVAPVDDRGQVILEEYEKLLGPKTRLVAIPIVSNALGTVTPVKSMIDMAHRHGATVLVDAAQAVSHLRTDVQALGCDFLVFSGHKVFAPTGIGAVFGTQRAWEETPPWHGGGNMIQDVTFERTVYQPPPARFEAGTGNIADAVGLGAALDWLTRLGLENVAQYEHALLEYGTARLERIPGLRIIGTAPEKAGVISFVLKGYDTHAVSEHLDRDGIAVRGGHHCAQPILRRFGLESTVRASFAPYNTFEDIDALVESLCRLPPAQ